MGLGFLFPWLLFLLPLLFTISASQSQQPNTDGSLVRDFLQQMRAPPLPSTSSSICPSGIPCETQGDHVIRLVASGLGLRGGIPANTIGKLSKLQHLDLSNNSITGFASDFWGLGESLRSLDLSANRIGGFLPNDVGNLGELESLDLSRNELSGQLPRSIGSLQRLSHLNLSTNMLEGSIPNELLQCRSLVTVDLSSNRLDGSVPDGLGSAFVNITALNLAGNRITGRLPDFSGSLSITYLNVSGNLFSDSISGVLRRPLQVVDLSNNRLTGHISQVKLSSSSSGWPNLTYLDLSGNRLSGFLFDDLSEARSLRHLNIAGNRFSRQSFPALGKLSSLQYLNLSRTGLTGKIPREMSMLVGLSVLDLCQNHLTGRIPDLRIQSLEVLDLSTNNLTGDIPLLLQEKLPHMLKFNFSYNNLTFCSSKFSPETLKSAFVGSHDDCPIAANPPDPAGGKKGGDSGKKKLKLALAISLSAFFFVVGLVCLALGCRRRRGRRGMPWDAAKPPQCKEDPNVSGPFSFETDSRTWVADVKDATSVPVVIFEKPLLSFTFADLLSATSHFDRGTLLAEGKFGPVYRGLLPGGIHVAVKVLVHGSTLSDQEAAGEFERLGRIKHTNLVPLTGYCLAGDQRIAVYEYMEHGNLQNLLHDLPLGIQTTDDWTNDTWEDENDGAQSVASEGHTTWRFRHMIVLGVARALAFLHHGCIPQIIHRDVKASSIFLGSEFEPRLSDFGLAKIVGTRFEDEIARGAPGYAPPELSGPEPSSATTKTDVYAFGVVLFELLTGKKPIGDEYPEEKDASLVAWVRGLVRKNRGSDAIDPKIHGTGEERQMEEALRIGYLCTADTPSKRPSMQQVVGLLKDIEPGGTDQ